MYDNKERESLDKFEGKSKGEDIGYVFFSFIALSKKELNSLTNMGKKIKSLNHLVYIPKIGWSYNCLLSIRIPR